jgi:hypothetical protein
VQNADPERGVRMVMRVVMFVLNFVSVRVHVNVPFTIMLVFVRVNF